MRQKIISQIIHTTCGLAINLEGKIEIDEGVRKIAYLDYSGKYTDFDLNLEYSCELFYRVTYPRRPEESNKEYTSFTTNTVEEMCNHPEFVKYKLTKERIVPYFRAVPNKREIG